MSSFKSGFFPLNIMLNSSMGPKNVCSFFLAPYCIEGVCYVELEYDIMFLISFWIVAIWGYKSFMNILVFL